MGFSKQEYWSGLPCPPPGDLSDPGVKPVWDSKWEVPGTTHFVRRMTAFLKCLKVGAGAVTS